MLSLGIDTSNYTTSVALYDGTAVVQKKQQLPVKPGALGLRQSDALFHHTVQLPELLEQLLSGQKISVIGVSNRPRAVEGSYMPCFLAGMAAARAIGAALNIPVRNYSHQQGHLMAALYSTHRIDLLKQNFIALHVSGGTTEGLFVHPGLQAEISCAAGDLKAGQLVDRVGVMLGFSFPAGPALDKLSQAGALPHKAVPSMEGARCHLSGVENQCRQLFEQGVLHADIARYCMESVAAVLERMIDYALKQHGNLPVICAGGVCCSQLIRTRLCAKYTDIFFAAPDFSADNATGVAILAGLGQE